MSDPVDAANAVAEEVVRALRRHHPAYEMIEVALIRRDPFQFDWLLRVGSQWSYVASNISAMGLRHDHRFMTEVVATETRDAAESFVWCAEYAPEHRNYAVADFAHDTDADEDVEQLHQATTSFDELVMLATPGVAWGTR